VTGAEGLQTRAFVALQLEQFEPFGVVLRGGHELQLVVLVGEQHPHGGGADQIGGADREHVQEIAKVEIIGESVGRLDEDLRQLSGGQGGHEGFPLTCSHAIEPSRGPAHHRGTDVAGVVTGGMMLPGDARMNT
jgi:hypothetical protein